MVEGLRGVRVPSTLPCSCPDPIPACCVMPASVFLLTTMPHVSLLARPGHNPELYLYDEAGQEVERMWIDKLSYEDLRQLMTSKGFVRQEKAGAAVAQARRMLLRAQASQEATAC